MPVARHDDDDDDIYIKLEITRHFSQFRPKYEETTCLLVNQMNCDLGCLKKFWDFIVMSC